MGENSPGCEFAWGGQMRILISFALFLLAQSTNAFELVESSEPVCNQHYCVCEKVFGAYMVKLMTIDNNGTQINESIIGKSSYTGAGALAACQQEMSGITICR